MKKSLYIAIVAGEESGDILGASLLHSLKKIYPDLHAEGIGGSRMEAEGFHTLFPMERLAVMGLIEPIKRLPELLGIRKTLIAHFTKKQPDVFIGIDSPDFNLDIEGSLKKSGIKTVHYVSPSVWAWRQKRIFKIKKNVDLMLTLFPFESDFYLSQNVPVCFVGHPLADQFELAPEQGVYRRYLGLEEQMCYIAVLPGSREAEVRMLTPVFIETMKRCLSKKPDICFLVPAASEARKQQLELLLENQELPVKIFLKHSREVMAASDIVLMASGTTTLEALLLKRPMVVSYKMSPVSYAVISRMLRTPYVALPNLLSGKLLVPELIQKQASAENLASALLDFLDHPEKVDALRRAFYEIHQQLRGGAGDKAAAAINDLLKQAG